MQADPIRLDAGDVNLYRYVGNNGTWLMDAFGLCAKGDVKFSKPDIEVSDSSGDRMVPSVSDATKDLWKDIKTHLAVEITVEHGISAISDYLEGFSSAWGAALKRASLGSLASSLSANVSISYQCCCDGKWGEEKNQSSPVTALGHIDNPSKDGESLYNLNDLQQMGGDIASAIKSILENAKESCKK